MLDTDTKIASIKKLNSSTFRRLINYLKPYNLMLIGVLISLIITSASILMISRSIQLFIDGGIAQSNGEALNDALLYLIATISVLAIFTFCRFFLITWVGEKVISDMRRDIFKHILSLSPSFFETGRTGELLSRLTSDTTLLLSLISSSLSFAMRNGVMLMGGIVVLITTSPKLAAMLLLIIPTILAPLFFIGRKLRIYSRNSQDRIAELTSQAEQVLGALKVVQSYQREDFESQKFGKLLKEQLKSAFDRILLRGLLTAGIISLAFGGIGFVLWMGGHQVLSGELSAGELSAFVYIAIVCAGSVAALSDVLGDVQKAIGATERIFEFLSSTSEITEVAIPLSLPSNQIGKIEFNNVVFSYDKSKARKVFNDLSFVIEAGKVTALIGKSGAGKTSIFMLLEHFYNVDSGQILFDGIDISKLKLKDLRSLFTYVPQDPYIFSTTVYENILYGNPLATKGDVILAAEQAGCLEFIEKMPDGFDTELGDKGMKLSGGQRQRLAIARAILNDPKILLLDEATSALDSENEQLIQNALSNLMKGRTTVVIAHRLSTVMNADKIIVLSNGIVAEQGNHNDLIKNQNIYSKLAKIQFNN